MNKKVVQIKKKNTNGGGKMEAMLNRNDNSTPVQKSKGIAKFVKLHKSNNFSKCDDDILKDLFRAGQEFKNCLGLSDKDVYDLIKR